MMTGPSVQAIQLRPERAKACPLSCIVFGLLFRRRTVRTHVLPMSGACLGHAVFLLLAIEAFASWPEASICAWYLPAGVPAVVLAHGVGALVGREVLGNRA